MAPLVVGALDRRHRDNRGQRAAHVPGLPKERFWFLVCLPVVPTVAGSYCHQPGSGQPNDALVARQGTSGAR